MVNFLDSVAVVCYIFFVSFSDFFFSVYFSGKTSRWLYWKREATKRMCYSMSIWASRRWSEVIFMPLMINRTKCWKINSSWFIYDSWGESISSIIQRSLNQIHTHTNIQYILLFIMCLVRRELTFNSLPLTQYIYIRLELYRRQNIELTYVKIDKIKITLYLALLHVARQRSDNNRKCALSLRKEVAGIGKAF